MKERGKRVIPEKTRRPTASSGTIPTCENPVTRPEIEPGSSWREASVLIAQPPRPPISHLYSCEESLLQYTTIHVRQHGGEEGEEARIDRYPSPLRSQEIVLQDGPETLRGDSPCKMGLKTLYGPCRTVTREGVDMSRGIRTFKKIQWHHGSEEDAANFCENYVEKRYTCRPIKSTRHVQKYLLEIVPILSSILCCASHRITLRGNKSDSGNSKDLLELRVDAEDNILQEHLQSGMGNAKCISGKTQDEIIELNEKECGVDEYWVHTRKTMLGVPRVECAGQTAFVRDQREIWGGGGGHRRRDLDRGGVSGSASVVAPPDLPQTSIDRPVLPLPPSSNPACSSSTLHSKRCRRGISQTQFTPGSSPRCRYVNTAPNIYYFDGSFHTLLCDIKYNTQLPEQRVFVCTVVLTSAPGNEAELQLYRVMQRASLLAYYDTLLEMVVRLLASHLGNPGSIHSGASPGFSPTVIVLDDAAGWRVFSGISRFPAPAFRRCSTSLRPHRLSRPR
ncbi:hypothetical protein PR048_024624 [Dryococelus australis]|uniref:Nab N-terminal domain-containing protein n=1 Tax=Dryococelus australis TaxID=614101 RepID=A0ABQ9GP54_9NEOP|nr:hypothetical protein PR048_024624 [Dryococelus australis]